VKNCRLLCFLMIACNPLIARGDEPTQKVVVGSKAFTESVILGELATQLARRTRTRTIVHRQELGGTTVLWEALRLGGERGGVDLYPEYTGTLKHELLARKRLRTDEELSAELAKEGILMSRPLGFNDNYAIGMREDVAEKLNIRTISDLKQHPELRFGFSNEFMQRGDGWPALRDRYGLPQTDVRGLEHPLAYRGLDNHQIDATELYITDAEIRYYNLRVLKDDLKHFPSYKAVFLYRKELKETAPEIVDAILQLEGRIPHVAILEMNARARPPKGVERVAESKVAGDFLAENPYFQSDDEDEAVASPDEENLALLIWRLTVEHLYLVAVSLALAIVIALPLGIVAARLPALGQGILAVAGIVQTIPSLALLALFVPYFGLGPKPAIVALFLYSLLPIVRNTVAGLNDVPGHIRESAEALGLSSLARLRLVELPMAMRSILAGIKTSAVINVGTATLGGVIGAGGYGERIMTGVRLDDKWIICQGAIPAALLALAVQGVFELIERGVVPKGLRLQPAA
jgi:osmoprotectant transport system permease protein